MDDNSFSNSLLALHAQIHELIQGVGGDKLASVLDALSKLEDEEKKQILEGFHKVTSYLLTAKSELSRKEMIESLCNELLREFTLKPISSTPRLEVLPGGRDVIKQISEPISLDKARKQRDSENSPLN